MKKKLTKKQAKLKADRQLSRDKRNTVRKEVRENVSAHRKTDTFHVLFVSRETDNMEKILFALSPMKDDNYIINLPTLTLDEINASNSKSAREVILNTFGIDSNDIGRIEGTNIIVVKNFRLVENKKELVEILVRPYNEYTWYENDCYTTLYGERILKGNKLKDIFIIKGDLSKTYVFQDTITEIVIYRMNTDKVDKGEFIFEYVGWDDIQYGLSHNLGVRKRTPGLPSFNGRWLIPYDEKLLNILEKEPEEIKELIFPSPIERKLIQNKKS